MSNFNNNDILKRIKELKSKKTTSRKTREELEKWEKELSQPIDATRFLVIAEKVLEYMLKAGKTYSAFEFLKKIWVFFTHL